MLHQKRFTFILSPVFARYKERGQQEESPSQEEAGSGACGRSSDFAEPGWHECACAQVRLRRLAVALLSKLGVKGARSVAARRSSMIAAGTEATG